MNVNNLLTVIIPCYNGEKYIETCIKSVIVQTYTNLEILIIDDGSIDNTSAICEKFKQSDNRIKVIHQSNKGSSLTRKIGIETANGEYITFIDVDDWIHPQMYEIMMDGLIHENADIAQCGVCNVVVSSRGSIKFKHRVTDHIGAEHKKYNRTEGVLKILDDKEWQSYMWNKIYRKKVFANVTFPIGRFLDEDLSVMHQIFENAKSSIYYSSEFYYYRQGSVTQTHDDKNKAKKIVDRCDARWERFKFTELHPDYEPMLKKMHNIFISVSLAGYRWAITHTSYFSKEELTRMKKRMIDSPLPLKQQMPEYFSKAKRIEYFLFRHVYILYCLMTKCIR